MRHVIAKALSMEISYFNLLFSLVDFLHIWLQFVPHLNENLTNVYCNKVNTYMEICKL